MTRQVIITRICLILTVLSACAEAAPPRAGTTSTGPEANLEEATEPAPDWDRLIIDGVDTSAAAASTLTPRNLLIPTMLGSASRVVVTDPEAAPPDLRVTGFVYDDEKYGRYWVIQRANEMSQKELESWLDCDPAEGCQGSWSLAILPRGIRAVLIQGPVATSVVWLDGDSRFDVIGPAETFSADSATDVAEKVVNSVVGPVSP